MNKKNLYIIFGISIFIFIIIGFYYITNNKLSRDSDIVKEQNQSEIGSGNERLSSNESKVSLEELNAQKEKEKLQNITTINEVGISGDISLCSSIKDENQKNECFDNGNLAKASIEKNKKFCSLVKNEILKIRCKDNFYYEEAGENKNKSSCENIKDSNIKNKCSDEIILRILEDKSFSGSTEICNDLSPDNKNYCINKINNLEDIKIFNLAISSKNSKKCHEIKDKELLENCSDGINIEFAIKNNDINTCTLIYDIEKKEYCKNNIQVIDEQKLLKDAIDNKNLKLCDKIKDSTLKTKCSDIINLKIAIENIDNKKCDIIKDTSYKKECLDFFNIINNQK